MDLQEANNGSTKAIRRNVKGAPFRIGDYVRVTRIIDSTESQALVGKTGTVEYFEYSCGCGQTYPEDPMIGVRIGKFTLEFWKEELCLSLLHKHRVLKVGGLEQREITTAGGGCATRSFSPRQSPVRRR